MGLVSSLLASSATAQEDRFEPEVYEPLAPQVLDMNLRALTEDSAAPTWSEGEPVRIVEDLREELGPLDPVLGPSAPRAFPSDAMAPVEGVNFEGMPATGRAAAGHQRAVGPNHYIQIWAPHEATGGAVPIRTNPDHPIGAGQTDHRRAAASAGVDQAFREFGFEEVAHRRATGVRSTKSLPSRTMTQGPSSSGSYRRPTKRPRCASGGRILARSLGLLVRYQA